jgi:hypothetical protein
MAAKQIIKTDEEIFKQSRRCWKCGEWNAEKSILKDLGFAKWKILLCQDCYERFSDVREVKQKE